MRRLIVAVVGLLTLMAGGAQAATLNVVGGQLMGASDVLVDGSLYDVQFLDGTCIDLYNGCDESSDFTFQTWASATLAGQALLDQVFLDWSAWLFFPNSGSLNGCQYSVASPTSTPCRVATPFGFCTPCGVGPTLYEGAEALVATTFPDGAPFPVLSYEELHLDAVPPNDGTYAV
jgi:hypothetical protein